MATADAPMKRTSTRTRMSPPEAALKGCATDFNRWRLQLCKPSGLPMAAARQSLALRSRSPQSGQIPQQVVEVAIVQAIGAVDRHQRLLLARHLGQVRFHEALQPLARVHDLDRELVFVLPDAADALAVARDER